MNLSAALVASIVIANVGAFAQNQMPPLAPSYKKPANGGDIGFPAFQSSAVEVIPELIPEVTPPTAAQSAPTTAIQRPSQPSTATSNSPYPPINSQMPVLNGLSAPVYGIDPSAMPSKGAENNIHQLNAEQTSLMDSQPLKEAAYITTTIAGPTGSRTVPAQFFRTWLEKTHFQFVDGGE